jgi:hypothetical protein
LEILTSACLFSSNLSFRLTRWKWILTICSRIYFRMDWSVSSCVARALKLIQGLCTFSTSKATPALNNPAITFITPQSEIILQFAASLGLCWTTGRGLTNLFHPIEII